MLFFGVIRSHNSRHLFYYNIGIELRQKLYFKIYLAPSELVVRINKSTSVVTKRYVTHYISRILGTHHLTWRGGYGFLLRSEFFFRATQELEYFFSFPEFNIRLYDKNFESDYFFFLHQNQNIFLEKKHKPPFPPKFP